MSDILLLYNRLENLRGKIKTIPAVPDRQNDIFYVNGDVIINEGATNGKINKMENIKNTLRNVRYKTELEQIEDKLDNIENQYLLENGDTEIDTNIKKINLKEEKIIESKDDINTHIISYDSTDDEEEEKIIKKKNKKKDKILKNQEKEGEKRKKERIERQKMRERVNKISKIDFNKISKNIQIIPPIKNIIYSEKININNKISILDKSSSILSITTNNFNNELYIFYYDHKKQGIKILYENGDTELIIKNGINPFSYVYQNNIYISYFDANKNCLKLYDINSKSSKIIAENYYEKIGYFSSMICIKNILYIIYYNLTTNSLYYSYCNNNTNKWSKIFKISDTENNIGIFNSLISINNKLNIIYYDATEGDMRIIKLENLQDNIWSQPIIIDNEGVSGFYIKTLIVEDNPAVFYYDNYNNNLKYCRSLNPHGTEWDEPIIIDEDGYDIDVNIYKNKQLMVLYSGKNRSNIKIKMSRDILGKEWTQSKIIDNFEGEREEILNMNGDVIEMDENISLYLNIKKVNKNYQLIYRDGKTGNLKCSYIN